MGKISTKLLLLIIFAIIFSLTVISQPTSVLASGNVNGKVIDGTSSTPLEYATISIFTKDSVLVTGTITKNDGSFNLDLNPGAYYAIVQFIAYGSKTIENIEVKSRYQKIDLGTVTIQAQTEKLSEAVVTAEKSEMVIGLDKKVFNVGKDLSNTGKSATDILDNIPSVSVDVDGNVSLRGSDNLQILIDGKPSGLYNAGNTVALRSLPGNMIESVEIITNPSAKYEAEGMAGIINIILKKDRREGVNGSFEVSGGYPWEGSVSANVNFRREKINYFVNYGLRYGERPGEGKSLQRFYDDSTGLLTLKTDRNNERIRSGLSHNFRAGADYFINPKNTITAAAFVGIEDNDNRTEINYLDRDRFDIILQETTRIDKESENELDMEFSLNYEKRFTNKDHKLIAFAKYTQDTETEKSDITEDTDSIVNINGIPGVHYSKMQRSENRESEQNMLFQLDYTQPVWSDGKIEAGYRSEFREIDNPFNVEEQDSTGVWFTLPNTSDTVLYIENIHALYLQAGNTFGRFSIQGGIRAELSDVMVHLRGTNEKNTSIYLNWFPTLHTSYKLNGIHSMQLSYSRRIHRPHFWLLNPFYSYSDSRNIRSGNPNLKPEYTSSFEGGYLMNTDMVNFYAGLYYRYTTDVFERITFADTGGTTIQIPINLSERQSYGVESNVTLDLVKWWTLTGNIDYYRAITDGEYESQTRHSDDYAWNTRLNSRMRLPKDLDFQAIFFYRSVQQTTQGERKPFYMLDLALSKDILKGNGTLTFNVRDVLNSRKFRFINDQPDYYAESEFRWSSRSYRITFIYRLNQNKKQGKKNGGNGAVDMGGDGMDF